MQMSRSTQNTVNTVQPYLQHPTFPGPLAQNNFRIVMSDIALGDDNLPDVNIDELFDDMTYEESIIVSTKNAVSLEKRNACSNCPWTHFSILEL